MERLNQTHDSLHAFHPAEGVQAILGNPVFEARREEPVPPPSGPMMTAVAPKLYEAPVFVATDPFAYEADLEMQTPLWAPQLAGEEFSAPGPIAGLIPATYFLPRPNWPMDRLEAVAPDPYESIVLMRKPLRLVTLLTNDVVTAGCTRVPMEPRDHTGARHIEPLETVILPCLEVAHEATPRGYAPEAVAEEEVPFADKLLALSAFAAQRDAEAPASRRDPWPAAPFSKVHKAQLPLGTMQCGVTVAAVAPMLAGLRRLSIDQVPLVHGTWIDNLRAMGTEGTTELPRYEMASPALRPRLKLAAGSRYSVSTRDTATAVATIEPENLPARSGVSIPERQNIAAARASVTKESAEKIPAPGAAGLLPLAGAKANEPVSPATATSFNPPQPLQTAPMRPASHLEPIDAKPVADILSPIPAAEPVPVDAPLNTEAKPEEKDALPGSGLDQLVPPPSRDLTAATAWMHMTGFWKHAPRDLKLLVFGIPILLGLALNPSLKKIPYTAPPQVGGIERGIQRNFQTKLNEQWSNVKQNMVDRAAIALDEDFRAGLDDWTSRGGTTEWAFDATGFVRPGPLALYRPSIDLTDYQLQFLGMIDKKALSWVVRATDFDDYYVVKLVVLKPGPVPTIGVTRYAVIKGVAQDRADTIAFINAREDMLYRVRMDIHGDVFALTVQGQIVDSWSEPRLRKGGVGFFTARGEASRLRWVQVTHQYDMLGRLCAYLAPYNIPSTNGGWQP